MVPVSAQIRTGKSGCPGSSRISAQLYRSLPRSTWMRSRAQSIDVRQIASVIISAKPPRASWIGGASDVRPRSISFASSNQLTLLTDCTCDGMGRTPRHAICSLWLSPRLTADRATIGSPPETLQPVSKLDCGIHDGCAPGHERVSCAQMTMGKSSRSASFLICDGANLQLSALDVRNSLPRSSRFADWASSMISTSGPEARSTASSPRPRENILKSAGAHQSLTSMFTKDLAIPSLVVIDRLMADALRFR